MSGRGRQGPQANMLTNRTLGGLPLLLLGNKLNCLLQGPVRLAVPEEIRHDFLVGHSTYKIVFDYLITEVICVCTATHLTFRSILAQCCLSPQSCQEGPDTGAGGLCHFA